MSQPAKTAADQPSKHSSTNARRSIRRGCAIRKELKGIPKHNTYRPTKEKVKALQRELARFRRLPAKSGYIRHRIKVMEHTIRKLLEGRTVKELPEVLLSFAELRIDGDKMEKNIRE